MLKTPQNLTVPLRTYRKKTDKRVSLFLSEYYKNLIRFYGAQKIWCVWGYRGRGDVTLLHIGLRGQRLPQG